MRPMDIDWRKAVFTSSITGWLWLDHREFARATPLPSPRINMLTYTGLVREVPDTHRGVRQQWAFITIPPLKFMPLSNIDFRNEMVTQRLGYIGYRWVP